MGAAMIVASLDYFLHWPMKGGYNFISGPLADITLLTAAASFVYLHFRKHNCHVNGCPRLEWHPHPEHGHPVCKKHHPHGRLITAEAVGNPAAPATETADQPASA
jgi:hypothetical protein